MNTQREELNKKLLLWVNPKAKFHDTEYGSEFIASGKPYRTHSIDYRPLIPFTDSLDACFKWIVPKLEGIELKNVNIKRAGNLSGGYCSVRLFQGSRQYDSGIAETPSLALCLAIEKLIDSEVK